MSAVFLTRSPSNSRRWENTSLAGSFLIRSANPRTMGQIQTGWWDKYRRNNRTNTKGQIGPLSLDCFHMWLRSAETWLAEFPITSWIVIGRSPIGADAPDRRSLPVQPEPPTDHHNNPSDDHHCVEKGDHHNNPSDDHHGVEKGERRSLIWICLIQIGAAIHRLSPTMPAGLQYRW